MKFAVVRFAATGIFNSVFYFLLYILFSEGLDVPYITAHLVASAISIFCAYFLHIFFTFQTKPGIVSFLLFPISQFVMMLLQTGLLFVFVHWWGIPQQLAPPFVLGLLFPVTYRFTRSILQWRTSP